MRTRTCFFAAVLAVFALAGALVIPGSAHADGLGIYPTDISFKSALRGGQYFKDVGIISDFPTEQTYLLEAAGPASHWLAFVDPADRSMTVDRIVAPPRSEVRFLLRLSLPPEAANGKYDGAIVVKTTGGAAQVKGSGSSVNVGAQISVGIDIGGVQNIAGRIVDIATKDVEVGYPLRVETSVENAGNVQLNPELHVKVIDSSGSVVGDATLKEQVISPNESKVLVVEWDTGGKKPGDHVVRVSGSAGSLDLGTKDIGFRLMPFGSLTRSGQLDKLELAAPPKPGELAKFVATFRNTGKIDARATFVGELYQGSRLILAVTSKERFVEVGGIEKLEALAAVPDKGSYTLKGKVNYEGKETEEMELSFRVGAEQTGGTLGLTAMAGAGGAGFLLLAAAAAFVYRRRRGPQPAGV